MKRQDPQIKFDFSELLQTIWRDWLVLAWNMNPPFQSFEGSELLELIRNASKIVDFLKVKFAHTDVLLDLCALLELWNKISAFMVVAKVIDEEQYQSKLDQFGKDVLEFYKKGKYTFLTKNSTTPGDNETYYLHALRFYIPQIAKNVFQKHKVGVGIFSMQGFEQHNKASKNAMNNWSNNKHNYVVANLKRIYENNNLI